MDISVDLAHHWKRCFEQRFGSFDDSKGEAPVLEAAAQLGSSNGSNPLELRKISMPPLLSGPEPILQWLERALV